MENKNKILKLHWQTLDSKFLEPTTLLDSIAQNLDSILQGECIEILKTLPEKSIDLIFADPPYFMQTSGGLLRVEGSVFSGVNDEWDKFANFEEYDDFCLGWLTQCERVLKETGSIWVIGSFQNIFRLGFHLQNLGFWIINDVIWQKSNPVPNFKGTRFCNAHETLIWCAKNSRKNMKDSKAKNTSTKYTFNYKTMKFLNENKQEKSVWHIPLCTGTERLKDENGKKLHSTQKPEILLEKIILASSKMGDVILDPFLGTGTTGVVAKRFSRHFIGIEREEKYVMAAKERIDAIKPELLKNADLRGQNVDSKSLKDSKNSRNFRDSKDLWGKIIRAEFEIKPPRVSLKVLLKQGFLKEGQKFYDKNRNYICFLDNENLNDGQEILSIHKMAAKHLKKTNHNGWDYFYIFLEDFLLDEDERYKENFLHNTNGRSKNMNCDFISLDSLRWEWAKNKMGK